MSPLRRLGIGGASLLLGAGLWLPLVSRLFRRDAAGHWTPSGLSPKAEALYARQMGLWADPAQRQAEIRRMRASNAEWDFMGRSFFVWALANAGLRDGARKRECLEVMDRILDETLRLEAARGHAHFLMAYARERPYEVRPARSLFVDSEIALMLAARRALEEKAEYRGALAERVRWMIGRMERSPALAAESYPDECWTFDHSVALAAIRLHDALDGTDHGAFLRRWVETARRRLVDPGTGLLVSSFTTAGRPLDGPEGSSIWFVSHALELVDPAFAEDQYRRAKRELARGVLGFGYAAEWPASRRGPMDVDSGPVVPILGASAGSSGLAFVGAAAFRDREYLASLSATLDLAAFPSRRGGRLRYCAGNAVGDAVLLYSTVLGPLWDRARAGGGRP